MSYPDEIRKIVLKQLQLLQDAVESMTVDDLSSISCSLAEALNAVPIEIALKL